MVEVLWLMEAWTLGERYYDLFEGCAFCGYAIYDMLVRREERSIASGIER